MGRLSPVGLAFVVLLLLVGKPSAVEPDKQPEAPKSYTLSCKLFRTELVTGSDGKAVLDKREVLVPDLTSLEGTRAEYHTGGKLEDTPYGFRVQFEATPATGDKVRLDLLVEDSLADVGRRPIVRSQRQQVVRRVTLGKPFKLDLSRNAEGEAVWVELTLKEALDDNPLPEKP